ncbi:MAG: hypothetical protein Fues2KO_31960 [Fuerstiella sp.]
MAQPLRASFRRVLKQFLSAATSRPRRRKANSNHHHIDELEHRLVLAAGQNLALYEFTSHTSSSPDLGSTDFHSRTTASEITSPLSLGSTGNGSPPRGLALGSAFNETSEPTPAGGQPDYFEFTITPEPGYQFDVATFELQVRRNDPDSKNSFAVYFDEDPGSGGDNFSTKILTGVVTSEDRFDTFTVDVEGMSRLTDVDSALTFRVYAWGTVGTGTMRLDNIRVRTVQETVTGSAFAYYGEADRLIHPLDALGNRIADFSSAGYMNGNQPVPNVESLVDATRIVTVSPGPGDDLAALQAAINQVENLTPNSSGFRGIVRLTAGEFQISGQLQILESGILLQGAGDGADAGTSTILRGTGTTQRSLIRVGAASGFASGVSGTTHNIVDKYVPVGATSFQVDSTANWSVGDEVVVRRPSTEAWISDIGMDSIPPRSDGKPITQWSPGGNYDQSYERVIDRIEGNRIFLNAPITNAIEQRYGGGTVFRYTFPRIQNVGIEDIRGVSDFASDTDENHAWTLIELQAVRNAWVTNVTGQHFGYATVHATSRSMQVTVDDAVSLEPKSKITGGRRYPFVIDGQMILMKNLYSEEGRHDFVNNSSWRNRGPNVFLNGTAVRSNSSTGPHQRWSTGTLFDTISTDNQIEARNRGNFGSGHGWGGANMVFWNTSASSYIVQNPPTAQNWIIGGSGPILNETRFGPQPPPTVDAHETPIDFRRSDNPLSSLYVAQWNQRTKFPLHEQREYVLGDYDGSEFDGNSSADDVPVDAEWQAAITGVAAGQPLSDFDVAATSQFVPATFNFDLAVDEAVVAAVLTLGLRSSGGSTISDELRLDQIGTAQSFASLGLTQSLSTSETTPLTIELTGTDLERLQDGQLNLAVNSHTSVDWATLNLQVAPRLSVTASAATVRESETVTLLVQRKNSVGDLVVNLSTSDTSELQLPDTVTIPDGQTSVSVTVAATNDGFPDPTQSVALSASAAGYVAASTNISVTEAFAHRLSQLTVRVVDQNGDPLPGANVDIEMTQHGFRFGSQIRGPLLAISESDFNGLAEWQKQNLLPNLTSLGQTRYTPTWSDVLNYRSAVLTNFNHIVPGNDLQWIQFNNRGPADPDAAIDLATANGMTAGGVHVVWERDQWPTPHEFRPGATFTAQELQNALIAARLSPTGILSIYSDAGSSPTITDWNVLNEPLHETYFSDLFVNAGLYANRRATWKDYFVRADALRPDARLLINDYNILNYGSDAAAIQYRDLINDLLADGAPIDRIGVQAHFARGDVSKADMQRRLDILAETGLTIEITEFDTRDDASQLSPAQQQRIFEDLLEVSFAHPAVDGFIMWGFWDPGHWRGNGPLYDQDWNIKAEAAPWFDLVHGDWKTELSNLAVDAAGRWTAPAGVFSGTYRITATHDSRSTTIEDCDLSTNGDVLITIGQPTLSLTVGDTSIPEGAGDAATTATVTRSGDTSAALTVILSSDDSSEAVVPSTVIIAAGQASATFNIKAVDDDVVDGNQTVSLAASAAGYSAASESITVEDDDVATLTLSIAATNLSESGGSTTATVHRNTDPTAAMTVSLAGSDASEAVLPASIVIPAGQSSTTFTIDAVDDAIVDGSQTVTVTATTAGHISSTDSIVVTDNDSPELAITIAETRLDENGGSTTGTVTRNTDTASNLTVTLVAEDSTEVDVPRTVVIPAGQSSITFTIQAVDDAIVDGTQTVTLSAAADGYSAAATSIDIVDDDQATLTVTVAASEISENSGSTTATITRNTDPTGELHVTITNSDTTELTVPASVTVPSGQSSATFVIDAVDDSTLDHTQSVTVSASAVGHLAASVAIDVLDDERETPELTGPVPVSINQRPTVSWRPVANATSYDIFLEQIRSGANRTILETSTAATSITLPQEAENLGVGRYRAWVRARSSAGASDWASRTFVVRLPIALSELPFHGDDRTPQISWTPVDGAESYRLFVNNVTARQPVLDIHVEDSKFTLTEDLQFGRHEIWVAAIGPGGYQSSWSAPERYYIGPQLLNPEVTTFSLRPQFRWTTLPGIDRFQLYVHHRSTVAIDESDLSGTSFTPSADLAAGDHRWWIRPLHANGRSGAWSRLGTVNTAGMANITSPDSVNRFGTAEIQWQPVEGAGSYEVYLFNLDGDGLIQRVRDITSTSFQSVPLQDGNYKVWVRAFADNGFARWSRGYSFEQQAVQSSAWAFPAEPIQPTFDTTPDFSWSASSSARQFEIVVTNGISTLTEVVQKQTTAATSWTPSTPLTPGPWRWWVRAFDAANRAGRWSAENSTDTSGRPILLAPLGTTGNRSPQIRWTPVLGADRYVLQLDDLTNGQNAILRMENLSSSEFQISDALSPGNYRAWVRAISASGAASPWSLKLDFRIVSKSRSLDTLHDPESPLKLVAAHSLQTDDDENLVLSHRRHTQPLIRPATVGHSVRPVAVNDFAPNTAKASNRIVNHAIEFEPEDTLLKLADDVFAVFDGWNFPTGPSTDASGKIAN